MSEPVFHLFEQLPQELQMQIWKYAAMPEGAITIDGDVLEYIGKNNATRTIDGSSYHARFLLQTSKPYRIRPYTHSAVTLDARKSLLGTCRLSRQIILETWRAVIQATSIVDPDKPQYRHQVTYWQKVRARQNEVKEELLGALGQLIVLASEGKASYIPRRRGASRRTRAARPGMYKEDGEDEDPEEGKEDKADDEGM